MSRRPARLTVLAVTALATMAAAVAIKPATADVGVKTSSAVLCGNRVQIIGVTIRPSGLAALYEYRFAGGEGVARATGLVLATADYRSFEALCPRVALKRLRRPSTTIGPWPRAAPNLITCNVPREGLRIQAEPIKSSGKVIGTRLRIARGTKTLVDVTLKRRTSGISYDFGSECSRNIWPAPGG